jgi:four helix bundle protein
MISKQPHKNLEAWKKSMDLVVEVYKYTADFPKAEQYGLVSQMRRAAVSVPSNLAEGAADRTVSQFSNYLSIALGSLSELDTQTEIAFRLNYLDENIKTDFVNRIDHCKALIFGLRKSLNK